MEIKIPRIVKTLELKEYAEEFGEAVLEVWVNPPKAMLDGMSQVQAKASAITIPDGKLTEEQRETLEKRVEAVILEQVGIFSELLSQGREDTWLSVEELRKLINETGETDPGFWIWLKNRVCWMIAEHRNSVKKG